MQLYSVHHHEIHPLFWGHIHCTFITFKESAGVLTAGVLYACFVYLDPDHSLRTHYCLVFPDDLIIWTCGEIKGKIWVNLAPFSSSAF